MKVALIGLIFGVTLLPAQSPVRENKIHSIYVTELHSHSGNDNLDFDALLRSKLISALVEHCSSSCTVLEENPDSGTDAVLSGSVWLQTTDQFHVRAQAAMRLVDKDGVVLWAATVYSSPYARSATSSLADKTAKKLVAFLNGKDTNN